MEHPATSLPASYGYFFTPTIHDKAGGPTDPKNNIHRGDCVVCITGAGKGLGRNIALAYAQAGVSGIIISSRTSTDLDTLSNEIKAINPEIKVLAQTCDVSRTSDVQRLCDATRDTFSRVDVVIANAGIISGYGSDGAYPKGLVADVDFEKVIEVNVLGAMRIAHAFLPLLLESKAGAQTFIVNASMAAHFDGSDITPVSYILSKRAACHLAESLAADYGKDGVISLAIHPGAVVTGMTEKNSLAPGDLWDTILQDDAGLCGGFCTWLTKERREWLNGRYLSVTWDVEELEGMKDEIVAKDKLKFRMEI